MDKTMKNTVQVPNQGLTIVNAVYVSLLTTKHANTIPHITINLWDVLTQWDIFVRLMPSLKIRSNKETKSSKSRHSWGSRESWAVEPEVQDIIHQKNDSAEKARRSNPSKNLWLATKTDTSAKQWSILPSIWEGAEAREDQADSNPGALVKHSEERDRNSSNKKWTTIGPSRHTQMRVSGPTRTPSQGHGWVGRNSPGYWEGVSNAGRGRRERRT